jgi:hypothetical protein
MDLSHIYEPGDDHNREGKIELDMHADTCIAGANFRLIEKTGETITISLYSHHYKPLEDEGGDPVEIPLQLNGIIQYITLITQ